MVTRRKNNCFWNTANPDDLSKLKEVQKEGLPSPAPQPPAVAAASPVPSPADAKKSDEKETATCA